MRKIDKCKITIEIFPSRHDIFKCSAIPDGRTDRLKGRHAACRRKGSHIAFRGRLAAAHVT